MEARMEQLGLPPRASQTEDCRPRGELREVRRDSSRYGTPEDKSHMDRDVSSIEECVGHLQKGEGQVVLASQSAVPLEVSGPRDRHQRRKGPEPARSKQ
jgi:hypothetical protein